MKMLSCALAIVFFLLETALASDVYFLNAWTYGQRYRIMRYGADGLPNPTGAVINELNDGGAANAAWSSAFKIGNIERVYASRFYSGQWRDIGIWESTGDGFVFTGTALVANSSEPYGIGPAQAFLAPSDPRPFKMVYLIRNAAGAGTQFALASSVTGEPGTWQRDGVIYTASQSFEAFGISPSHVLEVEPGLWAITYQGYRYATNATLGAGPAAIITASSPNGPFGNPKIIMEPNGNLPGIVSAVRMQSFGTTNGAIIPGPYVLRNPAGGLEPVNVVKQTGNKVFFDRPLLASYSNGTMAHVAAYKIDPSMIYGDGNKWRAIFTGYGHFTDYMTEYTFRAESDNYDGPYIPSGAPIAFAPWTAEGAFSTENPTPLVEVGP